jgi:hypothetical protein
VSGERVRLVDDAGSITRLVDALADVLGGAGGPAALIGGLAVLARVGGAYRVTNDVDAVSEPDVLTVVLAEHGEAIGSSWTVRGVTIDLVEVGATAAERLQPADLPEDEADRIFVLAHQWALDTSTELEIVACDSRLRVLASASCLVATPAALVAMKTQSAPRRSAAARSKVASDYADVHRLLTHPGLLPLVAAALATAPHDLGTWVAAELERRFVGDAERIAGIIRTNLTLPPGNVIVPDDVRETCARFVTEFRLRRP